ncbi:MAG: hypothetical protein QM640_16950 [Niabella sp.]
MLKVILFNALFILALAATAFAEGEGAAGDDYGKEKPKNKFSLENNRFRKQQQLNSFSLRSGMYFKGENLINSESSTNSGGLHMNVANNITFQKGQNNYLLPYKKKAVLSKLTFNPNELLRNYSGK